MKRLLLLVALSSASVCPGIARAEMYGAVKFAGYFPQEGLLKNADTGFGVELGLGYRFPGAMAFEVEVGGYQTQIPAYVMGARVDTNFLVLPISANLVLGRQSGAVRPYVKGGIGFYYAEYEKTFGGQEGGSATGYQVGAGILIQHFAIEIRYLSAEPEIAGTVFDLSGPVISAGYVF